MGQLEDMIEEMAIGSARGRRAAPLAMRVVRELTQADAAELLSPSAKGTEIQPLAKLRHTHHMAARLLAEGRPPGEVALITGYSSSRISVLQSDPAFAELVAYYKAQVGEAYINVHERLAALGLASLDELQERLEADPESFKNRELMDLAMALLDRTVAPPKGGVKGAGPTGGGGGAGVSVNINFVKAPEGPVLEGQATGPLLESGDLISLPAEGGSGDAVLLRIAKEVGG